MQKARELTRLPLSPRGDVYNLLGHKPAGGCHHSHYGLKNTERLNRLQTYETTAVDDVTGPEIAACSDVCARALDSSHVTRRFCFVCQHDKPNHDSVQLPTQVKVTIFSKII